MITIEAREDALNLNTILCALVQSVRIRMSPAQWVVYNDIMTIPIKSDDMRALDIYRALPITVDDALSSDTVVIDSSAGPLVNITGLEIPTLFAMEERWPAKAR